MSGPEKNTLISVMDFTVDKVIEMRKSVGVLGEKIVADGITVIPVSKLSVGFAGGGADITDKTKGKSKNPAGTGVGITDTPLVFLAIKDGEVNVIRIPGEQKKSLAADIITTVIDEAKKLIAESKAKKQEEK
jgi:uncharacterized spore protein YtfJ